MPVTHFVAFYPSRPFWAGEGINFADPKSLDDFEQLMAEGVCNESDETFSLRICRDGMIMLRLEALESEGSSAGKPQSIESTSQKWGQYLNFLNSFYLLLDSSTIRLMRLHYFNLHEITNRDAFRVSYENGRIVSENVATESVTSLFQWGRYKVAYGKIPITNHPNIFMRQVISSQAIACAVAEFVRVVKRPGLEKTLATFTKSIAEYKLGNYETSIMLAWFISEAAISKLWQTRLTSLDKDATEGQRRISSKRMRYLRGRDFPIGVVENVLELSGDLPFKLFQDAETVRRWRNRIVHRDPDYSPKASNAELAITTALELSRTADGVDFTPSLGYSITGI